MLIRRLAHAIINPQHPMRPVRPFRVMMRLPVLFDIGSFLMQARDLYRGHDIKSSYIVDDDYHRHVHDYNAGVTESKQIHRTRRAEEYYQVLDLPPRDVAGEDLLIVGPRNVLELYLAWVYGFSWKRISAIDLYSTNPKIIEMNMEAMTFPPCSFDAVAMSATLTYAADTKKTLQGVFDVLRPGGLFAFGQTYAPDGVEWGGSLHTGADIKAMLDEIGFEVYFYRSETKVNSKGRDQTSHVFGVMRPDPDVPQFDVLRL